MTALVSHLHQPFFFFFFVVMVTAVDLPWQSREHVCTRNHKLRGGRDQGHRGREGGRGTLHGTTVSVLWTFLLSPSTSFSPAWEGRCIGRREPASCYFLEGWLVSFYPFWSLGFPSGKQQLPSGEAPLLLNSIIPAHALFAVSGAWNEMFAMAIYRNGYDHGVPPDSPPFHRCVFSHPRAARWGTDTRSGVKPLGISSFVMLERPLHLWEPQFLICIMGILLLTRQGEEKDMVYEPRAGGVH